VQALIAEAASLGLALTAPQIAAFERYQELLQYWNRRINLTTVDDAAGIRQRHFLDSLSCALVTGDLDGKRLVDVGTGAGFPGIPLKLLFPGVQLVLVESVSKKARFLQTVVQELALSGVEILDVRAETAGQDPSFREQFDWAVARAVAGLDVLLEYLLPFCRIGGHALAMKSERATDEVERARQAIAILGGGDPLLHAVQLPQRDEISYLVVVEKIAPTPERYPRRPGMPAKRPL
jgi:16S rRNA (guanine527-N7)-methyltransferase